jgi:N-acetylglucosamine repressor
MIRMSKPKNIKENNLKLVLGEIYERKTATVQELSDITEISKTTVNKLVAELVDVGIISSLGKGSSTSEGGRRPELYRLNAEYKYILSTEFYEDSAYCTLMDMNCNILHSYFDDFGKSLCFDDAIDRLRQGIQVTMQKAKIQIEKIGAVTVSCSAIVDENTGMIERPTNGVWIGRYAVAEQLQDLFDEGIPIIVNNIARFSGYAELLRQRRMQNSRVVTLLFWDDEIGGAMIDKGKMDNGSEHILGEIGHLYLGQMESIGDSAQASNEFENLVNRKGIIEYAYFKGDQNKNSVLSKTIQEKSLTVSNVFKAYGDGDEFAADIVNRSAYYVALVLHIILIVYDPEYILLQGFYYEAGNKFISEVRAILRKLVPFANVDDVQLGFSSFGMEYKDAYNVGACYYAVEKLIKNNFGIL